jgi:catechol-2,3-dioxygenase
MYFGMPARQARSALPHDEAAAQQNGWTNMTALGFSHYNLRAPRALLDELRDFYCDVVGLTVGHRPPFRSFGYWLYAGEHAVLHLSEAGPGENRPAQSAGTFDHAAFRCAGRSQYEKELERRGIQYRVAAVPATQQVQIFLIDPAGNGVELNFENDPLEQGL